MRWIALGLVAALLNMVMTACYRHYLIGKEDLSRLQQGAEAAIEGEGFPGQAGSGAGEAPPGAPAERGVFVTTKEGKKVLVTPDTLLYLTDMDGIRHTVPAFSFKVTESQLLAPEQDLVLGLGWIEKSEVRHLSTGLTLAAVGLGVLAAAAVTVGLVVTAGEETGF